MTSYVIQKINNDYVDITVKIGTQTFEQNLCGMPTDDPTALKDALTAYVQDYETQLNVQQTNPDSLSVSIPTASDSLIGQEVQVPDVVSVSSISPGIIQKGG